MFKLRLLLGSVLGGLLVLCSCSSLLTAYLVNELLNDKAPRRKWTGVVTDQTNTPLANLKVQIAAEVAGDDNILRFDDTTDDLGKFDISYRWSKEVSYTLRVIDQSDRILHQQVYGKVELADRNTDIKISGAFGVQLSGVVRDYNGDPISGALIIAATASSLGETPTILNGLDNAPAYVVSTQAGVYTISGTIGRYGIVCAYHPDHGFAYGYGEDLDNDLQVPVNLDLGGPGRYNINAQVIDGLGSPLANRVLEPDQQFRIRGSQPFNLSATMDEVEEDNPTIFPSLVTKPSVQHPTQFEFLVAATGANGVASGLQSVLGGNYRIELLRVSNDNPATALVISNNPLVLARDEQVVVRVN